MNKQFKLKLETNETHNVESRHVYLKTNNLQLQQKALIGRTKILDIQQFIREFKHLLLQLRRLDHFPDRMYATIAYVRSSFSFQIRRYARINDWLCSS